MPPDVPGERVRFFGSYPWARPLTCSVGLFKYPLLDALSCLSSLSFPKCVCSVIFWGERNRKPEDVTTSPIHSLKVSSAAGKFEKTFRCVCVGTRFFYGCLHEKGTVVTQIFDGCNMGPAGYWGGHMWNAFSPCPFI